MTKDRTDERRRLIATLLGPDEPELTCEECFEQIDRYVEAAVAGADPDLAVPGMRAHLIGCPACGEDHDSLLDYVRRAGDDAPSAR
jgi:hypothetical protein